jgi:hypothetical protein
VVPILGMVGPENGLETRVALIARLMRTLPHAYCARRLNALYGQPRPASCRPRLINNMTS